MTDIAIRTGVTRSTVSRVLNDVSSVTISPETCRKVMEVAHELGYRPNELARAVASGRSRTIGILAVGQGSENSFRSISGALEEAARHGYSTKMLVSSWGDSDAEVQATVRRCSSWRLDGLIVVNLVPSVLDRIDQEMRRSRIPAVYLEVLPLHARGALCVATDEKAGVRLGFEHLFGLGHRRIGFISGEAGGARAERRVTAFKEMAAEFDMPTENRVAYGYWSGWEATEAAVDHLMDGPEPPTALQCAGDSIAMVAIHTLRRRGMRIPEDISVVGFGDFSMATYSSPPLTTVAQSFDDMGVLAARHLLSQIESGIYPTEVKTAFMQPSLVVRQSTALLK